MPASLSSKSGTSNIWHRVTYPSGNSDENRDRAALYSEVANANNHPEWVSQIRATFAKGWIDKARAGWYYQDTAGAWQRK